MDDEAVSPVIGTILMVAIVVVLAATVFILLIDKVPSEPGVAPQHAGTIDEQDDGYTVSRGPGVDMSQYEWSVEGADVRYAFNETPTMSSPLAPAGYQTLGNGDWAAGHSIRFCGNGGPVSGMTLWIRHVPSNSLAVDVTFAEIAPCA